MQQSSRHALIALAATAAFISPALAATDPLPRKAFLGVQVQPGPDGQGVVVGNAVPGGTAATIGVRNGDELRAINGKPVRAPRGWWRSRARLERSARDSELSVAALRQAQRRGQAQAGRAISRRDRLFRLAEFRRAAARHPRPPMAAPARRCSSICRAIAAARWRGSAAILSVARRGAGRTWHCLLPGREAGRGRQHRLA